VPLCISLRILCVLSRQEIVYVNKESRVTPFSAT